MATKILLINKLLYPCGRTECCCFDVTCLLRQEGHTVIPFSMAHGQCCVVGDIPPQGAVL